MNSDLLLLDKIKYIQGYCPDLFSWGELANIINIRPLMTSKRVKLLDDKNREFSWICGGWQHDENCYPPSLIRQLLDEMVIYFTDMSRVTKKINDFATSIEDENRQQTDAHVYVCRNPELEHPFGAHFDVSHNIIVQCEGQTNFKVWDKVKDINMPRINLQIDEEPLMDVVMKPGDAIWIPMHYPHHAISLTPRLSVSFPFTEEGSFEMSREDRNWIEL